MEHSSNRAKHVFLALSGGVDSAVSAALLIEQGYTVTGVYMKNWSGDDFGIQADCPWEDDQRDAEAICKHLGIPFRSFNFEKQYRDKVVEYFFDEYKKGRTPNPDVMCNKEIKFKLFLDKALKEGADLIATGHYARNVVLQTNQEVGKKHALFTGKDDIKNQVYFLYNITQEQLRKTLFPVGHLPKVEVRKLAETFDLPNKNKPDSQGICFIGEIDTLKFLMSGIPEKPGEIIDIDTNEVVGEHNGVYYFTIGQRKGLRIGGAGNPYYVCKKDVENNIVYVCHSSRHPTLFKKEVRLENLHWINSLNSSELITQKTEDEILYKGLEAVIRYQQKPQKGQLTIRNLHNQDGKTENEIVFSFEDEQRAVTSGQSLVMFKGEECLGGGVIGSE